MNALSIIIFILVAIFFISVVWSVIEHLIENDRQFSDSRNYLRFLARVEQIKRKVEKAQTYDDIREVKSNLAHLGLFNMDKILHSMRVKTVMPVWGMLDEKERKVREEEAIRNRYPSLGDLTIDDLLNSQ